MVNQEITEILVQTIMFIYPLNLKFRHKFKIGGKNFSRTMKLKLAFCVKPHPDFRLRFRRGGSVENHPSRERGIYHDE